MDREMSNDTLGNNKNGRDDGTHRTEWDIMIIMMITMVMIITIYVLSYEMATVRVMRWDISREKMELYIKKEM